MSYMPYLYPVRLEASLHETIWGGRGLERAGWKILPPANVPIGESWETEVNTIVQNGAQAGKTLGMLVDIWGPALLGEQAIAVFGHRFPLLAKLIDANARLSVQVHPDDNYAVQYEGGQSGKTEFWYILAAEPGAKVIYGFKDATSRPEIQQAIQNGTLETLLHEELVYPGDVIFVPAGTVHAICNGVLLYELQQYSDITYRMYDYGRLTASGTPRELHIDRSLDVSHYDAVQQVKSEPVALPHGYECEDRCLVACRYFVTRELHLQSRENDYGFKSSKTEGSCIILTSLGAEAQVRYGTGLEQHESLSRGQTMVLPAGLGDYRIEGSGKLLFSYVPPADDEALLAWRTKNRPTSTNQSGSSSSHQTP